jgi:histidinol phosphatase-like enzyme
MIELDATENKQKKAHIALDLDGTLAYYDGYKNGEIGKPIPKMLEQLKSWLAKGYKVSIFTARLSHTGEAAKQTALIEKFLEENGLPKLNITCTKMYYFTHFVDDKAYHAEKNKGVIHGEI